MHLVCAGCSRPDDIMVVFRSCKDYFRDTPTPTLRDVSSVHVCVKCITASRTGSACRESVAHLMKHFASSNPHWHIIFSEHIVQFLHRIKCNPFEMGDSTLIALGNRGDELLHAARLALAGVHAKYEFRFPLPSIPAPVTLPIPFDPTQHDNDLIIREAMKELSEPCKLFYYYFLACMCVCVCLAIHFSTPYFFILPTC